jgi:hypothetical protein
VAEPGGGSTGGVGDLPGIWKRIHFATASDNDAALYDAYR